MIASRLLHTGPGINSISPSQFLDHFQRAWNAPQARKPLQSWQKTRKRNEDRDGSIIPRRLGLAVSGGADSMALAYLCKQLEYSQGLTVTGFVVDHKAREESGREARIVAGWLERIGIKPRILELDWTQNNDSSGINLPSKVTAFETHARRLRFQALGTACRDHQIEALLMGHHRDDNVETTLWRLCSGARGAGLTGIPQVARVPECHGLYGVSESGSSLILRAFGTSNKNNNHANSGSGTNSNNNSVNDTMSLSLPKNGPTTTTTLSTGGILICRPLLPFPKSSLLATCQEHGIPYVTDPTNFDPTLTPRNAIRYLLSTTTTAGGSKLPRALQTPSILSVIKSSKNLLKETMDFSNDLLRKCKLHSLDLGSGMMTIQFPDLGMIPEEETTHNSDSRDTTTRLSSTRQTQIQAVTLRRITELISPFPENHFSLRSYEIFTGRVFSVGSGSSFTGTGTGSSRGGMHRRSGRKDAQQQQQQQQQQQAFTVGGVMFRPAPVRPNNGNDEDGNETNNNTWILSRQPFMRDRLPTQRFDIEVDDTLADAVAKDRHLNNNNAETGTDDTTTTTIISNNNNNNHNSSENRSNPSNSCPYFHPKYTHWIFWDNRYWFRIAIFPATSSSSSSTTTPMNNKDGTKELTDPQHNNNNKQKQTILPLLIRPFQKSDLKSISEFLWDGKKEQHNNNKHDSPRGDQKKKGEDHGEHNKDDSLSPIEFKKLLSRHAPGHVRFTMPLITTTSAATTTTTGGDCPGSDPGLAAGNSSDNTEIPLALPTMQFSLLSSQSQLSWKIQWEWMYKMVDTEVLRLLGWSNNGAYDK